MACYPGTVIKKGELSGEQFLEGMFMAGKGLVMQQLTEITGLGSPAIFNWVNRGFIAHPIERRYNKKTVARIFIINMLREMISLDDIKKLLTYVNGNPDDGNDDIIPESKLYAYLCNVIFAENFRLETIDELIDTTIQNYSEQIAGAKTRVKTALSIICKVYRAEDILKDCKTQLDKIENKNIFGR